MNTAMDSGEIFVGYENAEKIAPLREAGSALRYRVDKSGSSRFATLGWGTITQYIVE
jgi:hypothetical protein